MIYIKEAYPPSVGGVEDRYTPGVRIYTGGGIAGRDYTRKGVTGRAHTETNIVWVSFEQAYKWKRDIYLEVGWVVPSQSISHSVDLLSVGISPLSCV